MEREGRLEGGSASNLPVDPVRLCCGQSHDGAACPDGLVMCGVCFSRFPVDELYVDMHGDRWDVCADCGPLTDYGERLGVSAEAGTLTTEQIRERDGWKCARCGGAAQLDVHHRWPRSAGRDERASNRVTLCRACHRWAHHDPEAARQQGWVVARSGDPSVVPVRHFLWPAGPILLLDDGGIEIWQD